MPEHAKQARADKGEAGSAVPTLNGGRSLPTLPTVAGSNSMSWQYPGSAKTRINHQEQAGRRAYRAGAKFNRHSPGDWQRGFLDERATAENIDRNRSRVGGPGDVGGGRRSGEDE